MTPSEGYVVVAQNNKDTDYVQCARVLAKSIRLTGDQRPITLISDSVNYPGLEIFDTVELLTSTNNTKEQWRLSDDWQVYGLSPYDRTLKIESDVIVTRPLDTWWSVLKQRDLVVATGTRDYLQRISDCRYYRRVLDLNHLPDVYNGITYFKRSNLAEEFFTIVKHIFNDWQKINNNLQTPSSLESADTDTVYAVASSILGQEHTTLPTNIIQWVHMKSRINATTEDWTQELVWELTGSDFRIGTISQLYPVHYHVKKLAKLLERRYDEELNKK